MRPRDDNETRKEYWNSTSIYESVNDTKPDQLSDNQLNRKVKSVINDHQQSERVNEIRNERDNVENNSDVISFNVDHSSDTDTQRLIDSLVVNLCLIERKVGRKSVDDMLSIIRNEHFDINSFNNQIRNVHECKERCREIIDRDLSEDGFKSFIVKNNDGRFEAKLYMKNILSVIGDQMSEANTDNFIVHPICKRNEEGEIVFSHMLETEYAKELVEAVKNRVLCHHDEEAIWMFQGESSTESFCGIFQMYSDKSAVTLKKNGISAYPVHIVFMNFTYEGWKEMIMKEKTIVAYLPINYEHVDDLWRVHERGVNKTSVDRMVKIELLHNAYELILRPLENQCVKGVDGSLRDGKKLRCHPIIGELTTDVPEGKDLGCILHGCQTKYPCVLCFCPCERLNGNETFEKRTPEDTNNFRMAGRRKSKCVTQNSNEHRKIMKEKSLSTCTSYFERSKLLLQNRISNVYIIMGFEPMHNFDLGMSKEMKNAIFNRLGSEDLYIRLNGGRSRTFKSCRTSILKGVNDMLKEIQTNSYVSNLYVDFSSKQSSSTLNGLFSSDGLIGMLEATNMRTVDYVFPFVSMFIDRVCGERWGPLTTISTMYIDLVQRILEREDNEQWTYDEVNRIGKYIKQFKLVIMKVLKPYQTSGFNTIKFHLLNHITEHIMMYGDLRMIEARFYENRHITYKEQYRRTSKRKSTGHEETMGRINLKNIINNIAKGGHEEQLIYKTKLGLTKRGTKIKLSLFRQLLNKLRGKLKGTEGVIQEELLINISKQFSNCYINLFKLLGDQEGECLLNLMKERVYEDEGNYYEHICHIMVVKSGTVEGGFVSNLDDINPVRYEIENVRRMRKMTQRYVADSNYGSSNNKRNSFVMIRVNTEGRNENIYWIGQARLLFWHVVDNIPKEFAMIRFMETTKPLDELEATLGCIILRWSTDDGIDYTKRKQLYEVNHPPSGWYDIIEVSSIVSVVQVVKLRYKLEEKKDSDHWCLNRYALNRFLIPGNYSFDIVK